MDGIYNGKPYFLMDDFGGKPTILGTPHISLFFYHTFEDDSQLFLPPTSGRRWTG